MWTCHKCGKPVFFAERKQSLGYDWHPECLRCEECGKRLNPGQHAEHKGVPYCHVPCYAALFGPQLFGHGTRVESHKSYGQKNLAKVTNGPCLPRDHMETKVKQYNQFFDNKSMEIRSREVNNRLILEGALRVYWGVQGVIHLKEEIDQRPVVIVRKRNSCRLGNNGEALNGDDISDKENDESESGIETTTTSTMDGYSTDISMSESMTFDTCSLTEETVAEISSEDTSPIEKFAATLPSKLDIKNVEWDEIDDLLQVERQINLADKLYQTLPSPFPSSSESNTPKMLSAQSSCETSSGSSESKSSSVSNQLDPNTFSEGTEDESTLKPMDFEDFKKSVHLEYVNGANSFPEVNDDTLKFNQPIDPSRINDSLKLYNNGHHDLMSKSFNCEQALRTIDPAFINDTFNLKMGNDLLHSPKKIPIQKSGSASAKQSPLHGYSNAFEINRSKSGPNCFGFTDSEDDATLRPATIRRNEVKYISLQTDCYPTISDAEISRFSDNTISAAGELTSEATEYISAMDKNFITEDGVILRKKTGSTAIKRRSGNKRSRMKVKRRCSINGHFYNRETSFFTPPHGSQMSVWITSLVNTSDVINLILEKYKVDSRPENFALFIVRDNGEQRKLKEDEYPLVVQVMMGPHEDVSRIFLMDAQATQEISNEVAQFLNLSIPECRAIIDRYNDELDREKNRVREKYDDMRKRITQRMESLKVRL